MKSFLLSALAALLLGAIPATAANITFNPAVNCSAATDVVTTGTFKYAYTWYSAAQTLNGVTFTNTNVSVGAVGTNLTLAGLGSVSQTAFTSGTAPFNNLPAAYKLMMTGSVYNAANNTTGTVTLNGLTIGTTYQLQVWVGDPRSLSNTVGRDQTIANVGGAGGQVMDFNVGNVGGGVGQYILGTFLADATTQSFTVAATGTNKVPQINALQLRTAVGGWSGTVSGAWDDTTANFSGQTFTQLKTTTTTAGFGDLDGNGAAVARTAITIKAGGVTGANASFTNSTLNYTLSSTDATGLTGAFAMSKTGTGSLTLLGANTFTGDTTMAGGTLAVGHASALQNSTLNPTAGSVTFTGITGTAIGGLKGSVNLSLQNNASAAVTLTAGGNNQSTLYSGNLSGAGALVKAGTGALVLSGTSSHAGGTSVNAGTLLAQGSHAASGMTVAGGTLLHADQVLSTTSYASLTETSGKITVDVSTAGIDAFNVTGNASFSGGVIELSLLGQPPLNTPLPLVTYGGTLTGLPTISTTSRLAWTLNPGTGTNSVLTITFTTGAADLVWTGAASNVWSDSTLLNWINGAAADRFYTIDRVSFTDTGLAGTVAMPAAVTPGAVLINNSTGHDYTFPGVIAGGSVTKSGTGTATLTATNTWTGGTTVNEGILQVGSGTTAGVLAGGAPIVINSPGTLLYNHTTQPTTLTNVYTGNGTLAFKGTGASNVSAYSPNGNSSAFAGTITTDKARINVDAAPGDLGTALVKVADTGQLFVSGAISFANNMEIIGVGWLETAGQLGALRIQSGANATGTITLTGNARIGNYGSTSTLSGILAESGGSWALDFRNSNASTNSTQTVSAASTRTGPTSITGEIFVLQSSTGLGSGDVTLTGNGTAARTTRMELQNVTLANNVTLNSTAVTGFLGALHASGGTTSTVNGTITVAAAVGDGGHLAAAASTTSVLRVMGPVNVSSGITRPLVRVGTVELGGGGNYLELGHAEGTLRLAATNGVNPSATLFASTSAATTFDLNGYNQMLASIVKGGFASTITNTSATASVLTLSSAADTACASVLTGALSLVKSGAGNLTLTGANSWTGPTAVSAGTLTLAAATLADTAGLSLATGSTLALAHTVSDAVESFYIDGQQQDAGVWGPVGSEAPHQSPLITGTGFIVAINGPVPDAFTVWIDNYLSLTLPADKTKDADPDHDGQSNFAEFAFGTDPTDAASTTGFAVSWADTNGDNEPEQLLMIAVRAGAVFTGSPVPSATLDGLRYEVQGSLDLDEFSLPGAPVVLPLGVWSGSPAPGGFEWQRFRLSGTPGRGFLRAVVRSVP